MTSAATHALSVSERLKLPVVSMPTLRDKAETGAVGMVAKVGFLLATEADCKQANGLGRTGTEWKTFVAYGHDPGRRPRISASAADRSRVVVVDAVALARIGKNLFPSKVEFGRLDGRRTPNAT